MPPPLPLLLLALLLPLCRCRMLESTGGKYELLPLPLTPSRLADVDDGDPSAIVAPNVSSLYATPPPDAPA